MALLDFLGKGLQGIFGDQIGPALNSIVMAGSNPSQMVALKEAEALKRQKAAVDALKSWATRDSGGGTSLPPQAKMGAFADQAASAFGSGGMVPGGTGSGGATGVAGGGGAFSAAPRMSPQDDMKARASSALAAIPSDAPMELILPALQEMWNAQFKKPAQREVADGATVIDEYGNVIYKNEKAPAALNGEVQQALFAAGGDEAKARALMGNKFNPPAGPESWQVLSDEQANALGLPKGGSYKQNNKGDVQSIGGPRAAMQIKLFDPYDGNEVGVADANDPDIQSQIKAGKYRTSQPLPLTDKATGDLTGQGAKLDQFKRLKDGYKAEYVGMPAYGGAKVAAARIGMGDEKLASWWQDYDSFVTEVRHSMFGGALTPNEQAAFDKLVVTKGMDDKVARSNIARQHAIIETALSRHANGLAAGGYNRRQVETSMGRKLSDLPDPMAKPNFEETGESAATPQTDADFALLPKGALYIDPDDQKPYRKK